MPARATRRPGRQLFGLAPWLIERFRRLSERYYRENRALAVRRSLVGSALSLLSTAGYYVAYLVIIAQTVTGAITLGTLTFLAASFVRGRDLIQALLGAVSSIHEESLYLRDLFLFFDMRPTIAEKSGAPPVPDPIQEGFRVDVGFQYPGSDRWAVRHLTFTLRPGERVALVGENGAGKTTLTKLLARLYDPTEGRITLDGVDLRDYDVASLRRAIGVIFQDFVRYDMRMAENIGVGEIEVAREYLDVERPDAEGVDGAPKSTNGVPPVPDELVEAAEKSLASTVIARVPDGWQQMLGRRFHDGVDLSGGEWQKVALARSYMREAQLIILDEPTAALDARRGRGVPAIRRAHVASERGDYLASLLHRAHGRPDPRTAQRGTRRGRLARCSCGPGRLVCGALLPAGGGISLTSSPERRRWRTTRGSGFRRSDETARHES